MADPIHSKEKSKDALLAAAKTLFAAKGYDGTSVKELADEAGVNISLISYHFGGKENLYRACIEQFGKERLAVAQRVLVHAKSKDELRVRLEMFVDEILGCHVSEPCLTKIIHRESELGAKIVLDVFKNTFLKCFETLSDFLRAAQKSGLMRDSLDSETTAMILFGAVTNFSRSDEINKKVFGNSISENAYRKKVKTQLMNFFMGGIL